MKQLKASFLFVLLSHGMNEGRGFKGMFGITKIHFVYGYHYKITHNNR